MNQRGITVQNRVTFGRFSFDTSTGALTRDGAPLEIAAPAAALLGGLLSRAGRVVAYHELAEGSQVMHSAPAAMRTAMKDLRRLLRDPADYPMFIETVRGEGYRFIAPVHLSPDAPDMSWVHDAEMGPSPNLVRWIGDDESSVGFAVILLALAAVFLPLLTGWWTMPLVMVPVGLRLGFRFATFRGLLRDGVSAPELRRALAWAEEQRTGPRALRGWRSLLNKAAKLASLGSAVAVIAALVADRFEPWTWSAGAQDAFATAIAAMAGMIGLSVVTVIADALVNPQPVLQRVRARACSAWRAFLGRNLPPGERENDGYDVAAHQEVNALLSMP